LNWIDSEDSDLDKPLDDDDSNDDELKSLSLDEDKSVHEQDDDDDHDDEDDDDESVIFIHFKSLVVFIIIGADDAGGEFGWMWMWVMGGKSCVGSMGSSFVVWIAGVGQNAGVERTLMVVSPFKSRMGENGVKEVIEKSLRSWVENLMKREI